MPIPQTYPFLHKNAAFMSKVVMVGGHIVKRQCLKSGSKLAIAIVTGVPFPRGHPYTAASVSLEERI